MSLIQCPECKKNISETANSCPRCGWQLNSEKVRAIKENQAAEQAALQKKGTIYVLGIVAIFVVLIIIGQSADKNAPSNPTHWPVTNSQWDGSVSQVKQWFNENARDPDSLQYIEWSPVVETGNGFRVRVKFRAKNGFGGYDEPEQRFFTFDRTGKVIDVRQ